MEPVGLKQQQIITAFLLTIGLCVFFVYRYNAVVFKQPNKVFNVINRSFDKQFRPKVLTYDKWENEIKDNNVSNTNNQVRLSGEQLTLLNKALQNATERFTIIIWEPPFGAKGNPFSVGTSQCGACYVTYDKEKVSDPNTKAIIFHFNEVRKWLLPKERRLDQFYVWSSMEGTRALRVLRGMTLREYDGGVFNLTMTYRRDSDVYQPYNLAENVLREIQSKGSGNYSKDVDDLIRQKDNLALWIVSNCGTTKGARDRLKLSQNLINAGLNHDRRGTCFPKAKKAPRGEHVALIRRTKFYLSFENNHFCKDYITEKFFTNGLQYGAVPVVWGAKKADYEKVAPPNSFIFVEDFPNVKDLVKHLHYLDQNDTAYKEYLSWRVMRVENMPNYQRTRSHCQLCRILHGINIDNVFKDDYNQTASNIPLFGLKTPRIVPSLADWFYGLENKECALGI